MTNPFKVTKIEGSTDLNKALFETYGTGTAMLYDSYLAHYVRRVMKNPEDKNKAFGMAVGYKIEAEAYNGEVHKAVILVWEDREQCFDCAWADNWYEGSPNLTTLSWASNLVLLSHASFSEKTEADARKVANAFHIVREYICSGSDLLTNEEVSEIYKLID